MTKAARIALLIMNVVMLMGLIEVRQINQMAFIQIQEINRQQRIEQQTLNRVLVAYLQAKKTVPTWASEKGYIMRRQD